MGEVTYRQYRHVGEVRHCVPAAAWEKVMKRTRCLPMMAVHRRIGLLTRLMLDQKLELELSHGL